MRFLLSTLLCSSSILFPLLTSAQFQMFEHLFNQGGQQQQQHHHQRPQNVASDSEWYQRTYDSGMLFPSPSR